MHLAIVGYNKSLTATKYFDLKFNYKNENTICPRSSYLFYIVTYYLYIMGNYYLDREYYNDLLIILHAYTYKWPDICKLIFPRLRIN